MTCTPRTGGVGALQRPVHQLAPQLVVVLAAHELDGLRDVRQLVDDQLQGLAGVAHATLDEHLGDVWDNTKGCMDEHLGDVWDDSCVSDGAQRSRLGSSDV